MPQARTSPENIARIMAAQGVSEQRAKQIARGHGATPEHGKIQAEQHVAGRTLYETRSSQAAERIIAEAARADKRVSVTVRDAEGEHKGWENMRGSGNNRHAGGIDARYLRDDPRFGYRTQGQTFAAVVRNTAFTATALGDTEQADYYVDQPTGYTITVYD